MGTVAMSSAKSKSQLSCQAPGPSSQGDSYSSPDSTCQDDAGPYQNLRPSQPGVLSPRVWPGPGQSNWLQNLHPQQFFEPLPSAASSAQSSNCQSNSCSPIRAMTS